MKTIIARQRFTLNGRWGVGLFLVGPIISCGSYVWLLREFGDTYTSQWLLPAMLLFFSSMACLAGLVLMLVGRAFIVTSSDQNPDEMRDL